MRPIVWLASFPKSGNTWLRLLLANLASDAPVRINELRHVGITASGRLRLDETCLVASGLLHHHEADRLRPAYYRWLAAQGGAETGQGLAALRFLKTHDAWTRTDRDEPLLGGAQAARAAVLVVRDPRDIAASLANHNGQSLDAAITLMAQSDGALAGAIDRQPLQLRQRLLGWSGFCASWLDQTEVPVHLLRYEDMHADAEGALAGVLSALGIEMPQDSIARAVAMAKFDRLRDQEEAEGFREAPVTLASGRFFRSGRTGGWREELREAQRLRIEADHGAMMRRLGYSVEAA